MRIGIVGDIHYCMNSSLIRLRGEKYSLRIENCIKSINWAEQFFKERGVDFEVYLGDFFDQPKIVAEEITALNDIKFNATQKYFLVGNHEMARSDLAVSSAHVFEGRNNIMVIDQPLYTVSSEKYDIVYLPYILQNDRKHLIEYINNHQKDRIIFSHNDIAGMNLGHFTSKDGFSIDEINENCVLFINGHLHNSSWVGHKYKIFNAGNLTGQNFSEDAFEYGHNIYILDTETLKMEYASNPYAFNFYKINDINLLSRLKDNAVLTVKCNDIDYDAWKKALEEYKNRIVTYRIIVEHSKISNKALEDNVKQLSLDHLSEFKKYILEQLGTNDIVTTELEELCK